MNQRVYRKNGLLHKTNGPAMVMEDGSVCWYSNGIKHRIGGPAVKMSDGSRYWYFNGVLHREDGPAIEYHDGTKYWYFNGKKHRLDGPAVEKRSGKKQYWILGVQFPPETYEQWVLELTKFNKEEEEKRATKLTKVEKDQLTFNKSLDAKENERALEELNAMFNYVPPEEENQTRKNIEVKKAKKAVVGVSIYNEADEE